MRCRECVYACGGLDDPIAKQHVTFSPNNKIGLMARGGEAGSRV